MPLDLKNYIKWKIKIENVDLKPSRPGDDQNPLHLIKSTTQTSCKTWPTGQPVPLLHSTVTINYIPKRHVGACCAQFTPKGPHLAIISLLKVTKASSTCRRFAVSHNSEKDHFPYQDNIILMPHKPQADSWIFTSQAERSDTKQRKEELLRVL